MKIRIIHLKKEPKTGSEILNEFQFDNVIDWAGLKNIGKIAGNDNCIYLKFLFIILNMVLRNWARLACGCNSKKIKEQALDNYINALSIGRNKNITGII